jgi:hypothetical protein
MQGLGRLLAFCDALFSDRGLDDRDFRPFAAAVVLVLEQKP